MTSFYSENELKEIGLCSYGKNVLISRKASIYNPQKIILGSHVRVDDFAILSGTIRFGSYIHIAAYTALYSGDQEIIINDFANLSSRVSVYAESDDYSGVSMTNPTVPVKYKKLERGRVMIERHVIIGSTSVVLPGVILAEGSAFGSFSFIDHDSEPWSINVGIPFRKIKDRKKDLLEYEEELLAESGS